MEPRTSKTPWFRKDPDLALRHQTVMAERFPGFRWVVRRYPNEHAVWRGNLSPFSGNADPGVVAACLREGCRFYVLSDGQLEPADPPSTALQIEGVKKRTYLVEVLYLEPPAIPLVYVPQVCYAKKAPPHVWSRPDLSGFYPTPLAAVPRFACVMAPHIDSWSWKSDTPVRIIEYAAIWLANVELWKATGKWWGPEASHDPRELESINPEAPCWCGSGRPYGSCHLGKQGYARSSTFAEPKSIRY